MRRPGVILGVVLIVGSVFGVAGAGAGASPGRRPVITLEPQNAVALKARVALTADATGLPRPRVQWYTLRGDAWTAVAGATHDVIIVVADVGAVYRAVFSNRYGVASTRAARITAGLTPIPTNPTNPTATSTEWSGYAGDSGPYSAVSGSFTVPSVTCGADDTYALEWLGIDGWGSSSVEQAGTETDCLNGVPLYRAFYEMWGDQAENDGLEVNPVGNYPVAAGDDFSVSVSLTPLGWSFVLTDATAGWTFATIVASPTPAPAQYSVEAVVEAPREDCPATCDISQLAQVSPVTFTNLVATGPAGANPFTGTESIILTQNGSIEESPGPLVDGSFTDSWTATAGAQ